MRIDLVRIGNSQGIRLPKSVIEQAGLTEQLDLEISDGAIVIRPAGKPREGWSDAAALCHELNEDALGDWDALVTDFEGSWE